MAFHFSTGLRNSVLGERDAIAGTNLALQLLIVVMVF